MRSQKIKLALLTALILFHCYGDEGATTISPLVIENQSFNASENVDNTTIIGTIQASDPEKRL